MDYEFVKPRTPQKYWKMKQNMGWLKLRDLSRGASTLNAKYLCTLVQKYMKQNGGDPPIKQDISGNVENIEHMLESFSIMMAACMHSEYCKHDIHLLDLKIKVFLSDFARFDEGMKSRNDALNEDVIIDTMDNDLEERDFGDYHEEPYCVIRTNKNPSG
jgi:hypothetical protein